MKVIKPFKLIKVRISFSVSVYGITSDDHGVEGGSEFGSATDNKFVYVTQNQIINTFIGLIGTPPAHYLPPGVKHTHILCQAYSVQDNINPLLVGTPELGCQVAPGSLTMTQNSYISALNALNGKIVCQVAIWKTQNSMPLTCAH
jgi:hypothetical protein